MAPLGRDRLTSRPFLEQMRAVQKHLTEKNVYAIIGVTHYVDHVIRSRDGETIHVTLRAYPFPGTNAEMVGGK